MHIQETLLRHFEQRSAEVRAVLTAPEKGWIRQMREALGLTLAKLGDLCGVATPTIAQAERREVSGSVTLETLRRAANAMNCDFVYIFAPKSSMEEFVQQKAYEKAQRILARADLHMSLENQKVRSDVEERIKRLQKKLIADGKVW